MNLRILTPALVEIREAAGYYEERVCGLGAEFLDEMDAAIGRILDFPEAWSPLGADFRRCHLSRFPYSVIYTRPSEGDILVISVFHQSREPNSWRKNL